MPNLVINIPAVSLPRRAARSRRKAVRSAIWPVAKMVAILAGAFVKEIVF